MYHYQACGLPNVYLLNGYERIATAYGKGVTVHDVDGLHKAIATIVVESSAPLSGAEFRFLRNELELSQSGLAEMLGCNKQAIARWEKGINKKIDQPAERLLRLVYRSTHMGDKKLATIVKLLQQLECEPQQPRKFVARAKNKSWCMEERSVAA
jgi:putative transcriptional regulator